MLTILKTEMLKRENSVLLSDTIKLKKNINKIIGISLKEIASTLPIS